MNMSESQKRDLQMLVETGVEVSTVAYNPNTIVGNPEATALADGWIEYFREDSANLVQVVYTR